MYILGIETSCDETSAAVVENGNSVLANETATSLSFHKKYGGVIPEIASRMQLETIAQVTDSALRVSGLKPKDIKGIAVTDRPGLPGSLLVGVSFAKSLSLSMDVPFLGIDHLQSHIYSGLLDIDRPRFPFIALIVSGGHTSLFFVKDFDCMEVLGQTHDDAAGEAFDKVAKILGLGYPGGPAIEKLSAKGNPRQIRFKCSETKGALDFSFSGIKTAVLYMVKNKQLSLKEKADIAASFQESLINVLVSKSWLACEMKKCRTLVIGGGVAANQALRDRFMFEAGDKGVRLYFPERKYCTDNAAMVAGLGYHLLKKGYRSNLYLSAKFN